jgi:hypothetical protein
VEHLPRPVSTETVAWKQDLSKSEPPQCAMDIGSFAYPSMYPSRRKLKGVVSFSNFKKNMLA